MNKISWCKKQNKGIKIIEPNDNLAEEYFKNAEETLLLLNQTQKINNNMWKATQTYYNLYFLATAILYKIGIKSEIHSCTIEIIKLLEKEKMISNKLAKLIEENKELRIENQYYLKNKPIKTTIKELQTITLKTRTDIDNITEEQTNNIKKRILTQE